MTAEARERKRLRDRERYHRMKQRPEWNSIRDERAAKCRKYRAEHREERLARERAWKKANPDKMAEQRRRYYERVKADPERLAHARAVRKEYMDHGGGRELSALWNFARWRSRCDMYRINNVLYAEYRRKNRERWARKVGSRYRPNLKMRIPDWAVMGQDILDKNSTFIYNNLSKEQVISNRDFAFNVSETTTK